MKGEKDRGAGPRAPDGASHGRAGTTRVHDGREAPLTQMDLDAHLADPSIRQRFVTAMFDIVAPRYDRFTRVFSFGMDAGWKRELLRWLEAVAPPKARVLDLACGTGDLALAAARVLPDAEVMGLDASPRMILAAEARRGASTEAARVRFLVGDMLHLPAPDASVDLVTVGYGLRNVPDPARGLAEIARVLRVGGRVLCLDFHRPESAVWRWLFLRYLATAGNVVGWLWHRQPVVYGYIARSIEGWTTPREFRAMLERAGFVVEDQRTKLLGGVASWRARKR